MGKACIALTCARTHHDKNARVIYRTPEILFVVPLYLLMVHSFTFFITIFNITFIKHSACLRSILFFLIVTSSFSCTCYLLKPWLSLLQDFIQQSLYSGSAQVKILLVACWKFEIVRISDNGSGWK